MLSFTFNNFTFNWLFTDTSFLGTFRNDYVYSLTGRSDTISTGAGNDYIASGRGSDVIEAGTGDDIVLAGRGSDIIDGGAGDDQLFGERGNDTINGGDGDDIIDGGRGRDILRGGSGNDQINGGRGRDTIIYTASEDAGNDIVDGGLGQDTLVLELTAAQLADAAVQADIAAYEAYVANGSVGSYEFTTIGLTVTGGFEALELVDLSGPVEPTNTAPVVSGPVELADLENGQGNFFDAALLLSNTSDADEDPLSIIGPVSASSGTITEDDGGFVFTPADDTQGLVTLTYQVTDGTDTVTATATFTVAAPEPVNTAPTISGPVGLPAIEEDAATIFIPTADLLATATDLEGDELIVEGVTSGAGGTISPSEDGDGFEFTPDVDFNGIITLSYTVSDGEFSVDASASIEVTPVDDAAVVDLAESDLENTGDEDTPIMGTLVATDIDNEVIVFEVISQPANGSVEINGDTYTYTPTADFNGQDSFTFSANGGEAVTVNLTIEAVDDAGVVDAGSDINPTVAEDEVLMGIVTITDIDGAVTYGVQAGGDEFPSSDTQTANGTVSIDANGAYTYTPNADFNGTDSFTIVGTDINGGQTFQTVTVTVEAVDDAGVVDPESDINPSVAEDDVLNGTVIISDIDGAVTYGVQASGDDFPSASTQTANGTVSIDGNGNYTYTPNANYSGSDGFTVVGTDVNGGRTFQNVSVKIDPVNDAPVANDVSNEVSVSEDDGLFLPGAIETLSVFLESLADDIDSVLTPASFSFDSVVVGEEVFTDIAEVGVSYDDQLGNFELDTSLLLYQRLSVGEQVEVAVNFTVTDGELTDQGAYFVTVDGANDAPEIDEETSDLVVFADSGIEFELPPGFVLAFGDIDATDVDQSDTLTYEVTEGGQPQLGNVFIDQQTGFFEYEANFDEPIFDPPQLLEVDQPTELDGPRFEGPILVDGPSVDFFEVQVTDSAGASDTVTVQVNLPGGEPGGDTPTPGNDLLFGTPDNDIIDALAGNDIIVASAGNDVLTGGEGFDTFEYFLYDPDLGSDTITDFTKGEDQISIIFDDVSVNQILNSVTPNDDGTFTYSIGPAEWTVGVELDENDIFVDFGIFVAT